MNKSYLLLFIFLPGFLFAQQWTNITNPTYIKDILYDGSSVWMSTHGGVLHYSDYTSLSNPQKYTSAQGLWGGAPKCLAQSPNGQLYGGTFGAGIFRLENERWNPIPENDSLKHKSITSLHFLKNGVLLVGTSKRLYSLKDGKWQEEKTADGKKISRTNGFWEAPDGRVWAYSNAGALEYDGTSWTYRSKVEPPKGWTVKLVFYDKDGEVIMVGTKGVYRWKNQEWTELFKNTDQRFGITHKAVWDGKILYLADGAGRILRLTGKDLNETLPEVNVKVLYPNKDIMCMKRTPDGKIWLSYIGDLTHIIQGNSHEVFPMHEIRFREGYLEIPKLTSGTIDSDGNKWFTSNGGGVIRFNGNKWDAFSLGEGKKVNDAKKVKIGPNGEIYAASRAGVFKFRKGKFEPILNGTPLEGKTVWDIVFHKGSMWIMSEIGISQRKKGKWTHYIEDEHGMGRSTKTLCTAFEDFNGELRFASYRGNAFAVFDGEWKSGHEDPTHPLATGRMLEKDHEGKWWLASVQEQSFKIYRKNGAEWINMEFPDELRSNAIRKMISIEDSMWVSTNKGAFRWQNGTWQKLTAKDGLLSSFTDDIFKDETGKLWLVHPYGWSVSTE